MNLETESHELQKKHWPARGRVLLAQFTSDSVVVYQAYKPAIGNFAAARGRFGGEFSFSRMTWVKTSFLWMMNRSGWGTKTDQEVTLAVHLKRLAFDEILRAAVPSSFSPALHDSPESWRSQLEHSEVRLQWDPDHDPNGKRLARRAIQLGLRGATLQRYAHEWINQIEDISAFVAQQRSAAMEGRWRELMTPREQVYPIDNSELRARLGVDP